MITRHCAGLVWQQWPFT